MHNEPIWWTSSSGLIECQLTMEQARTCHHQGQCLEDVQAMLKDPKISMQLAAIPPSVLAHELRDVGAWDAKELSNHQHNLERILWIAAGDLVEQQFAA